MKKGIGIKTVSLIGALVSILTIIEGTSVILGISTPENIVVPALLYYNVLFGVVGLGVSISLWSNPAKTLQSAVILAALHVTVLSS